MGPAASDIPPRTWQYRPVRKIPQAAGLYLAVLEFIFTLGWTVYAIYLPKLAASVGIAAGTVIFILMLDQAVFTVMDFTTGGAADKVSRLVGRLGHWVAAVTLLSCIAFVTLPFVAGAQLGAVVFLTLTMTWAITSSALRAPPLMLLGKYAARPSIPYLTSLAMLGLGVAGAVSPYLSTTLTGLDPRLPFIIASATLALASFALAKVERSLAKQALPNSAAPQIASRKVSAPIVIFALASIVLAIGFQLHFFFNSAPVFKKFAGDLNALMPIFWIGFSIGMFPASLITKRFGGMPVMGLAGIVGAAAILVMQFAGTLELAVAAQLVAGAAWGGILMSAFAAALAIGYTGAEGKTTGLLFSALAIATFARMTVTATGTLSNPGLAPLVHWAPAACWAAAGIVLLALFATQSRVKEIH
jgi:hypothetical protein